MTQKGRHANPDMPAILALRPARAWNVPARCRYLLSINQETFPHASVLESRASTLACPIENRASSRMQGAQKGMYLFDFAFLRVLSAFARVRARVSAFWVPLQRAVCFRASDLRLCAFICVCQHPFYCNPVWRTQKLSAAMQTYIDVAKKQSQKFWVMDFGLSDTGKLWWISVASFLVRSWRCCRGALRSCSCRQSKNRGER